MIPEQWEHLRELLARLLLLDTNAQQELIDRELADDTQLRAAALDLLTSFRLSTLNFPFSMFAALGVGEPTTVPVNQPSHNLGPGDMCGRYEVARLLGSGGMGRVYLANDTELSTQVALKVPSEHLLESPEARIRLRGEAHNDAKLRGHPHIATFIDLVHVDVKGRQFPVMVMEYVEGRSCADHLAEHPVSLRRALRWARQTADALEYAHDRGVLHCDLKPQNILVTDDDSVKVLDFGIARALYGPTTADSVTGTIPYMAPEQLSERRYTEAGDIYSLGVSIFELLTGRRPFLAEDAAAHRLEVLGRPAPALSSLLPDVPTRLDVLVARMLAKQPRERPQSMNELGRELDALLVALDPPPPGVWERWTPRLKVAGTIFVVLAFSGFVASMTYDLALNRAGRFSNESPLLWPVWGARMLVTPVVVSTFFLLPFVLATVLVRSLTRTFGTPRPVQRLMRRLASVSAGQLAVLVLLASILAVNLFVWRFEPALSAVIALVGNTESPTLGWLREENFDEHNLYRYLAFLTWVGPAWGWWVVTGRRRRRLEPTGIVFAVLGALVLSLGLGLWALPYRLLWQAELEKVHLGPEPCYVAGRQAPDLLLFCPLSDPPRSRVINEKDPRLEPDSKIEKIFTELNTGTEP